MSRTSTVTLLLFGLLALLGAAMLSGALIPCLLGGGAALIGGLYGLHRLQVALVEAAEAKPQAGVSIVLGAVVTAMLGRMLLLGLALGLGLTTLALSPVWIIISFFLVHLIAQGLELKLALGARRLAEPANASSLRE